MTVKAGFLLESESAHPMTRTQTPPEEQAARFLEELWPNGQFPVDPVTIAHSLGIKVMTSDDLPKDVSGAILKDRDEDPVIYLSDRDSDNRKRFTCAHELGHFVQRQSEDHFEYVDLRNQDTTPEEVFANQFAAALLMPKDEVHRLARVYRRPEERWMLARHFGVSSEAISVRLSRLGLL